MRASIGAAFLTLVISTGCAGGPHKSDDAALRAFLQEKADALWSTDDDGGVILGVVRSDHRTVAVSAGRQAGGDRIPENGRVRIGSVTKTFVATAVLQLADQMKIDIDARASEYIDDPGLPKDVTVRDLLRHTSGIPGDAQEGVRALIEDDPERVIAPKELLAKIQGVPTKFAPGEGWNYSNSDYVYLGLIIERVTRKPLRDVLRDQITAPLTLYNTYLAPDDRAPPVIRTPFEVFGRKRPHDYPYTSIATEAWASGAMVSTASDVGRFFDALFGGELLSEKALEQMKAPAPGSQSEEPVPSSYGLGLTEWHPKELSGLKLYGHGGGLFGFVTQAFYDPSTKNTYFAAVAGRDFDLKPTIIAIARYVHR